MSDGSDRVVTVELVIQIRLDQTADLLVTAPAHTPETRNRQARFHRNAPRLDRVPLLVNPAERTDADPRGAAFTRYVLPEVDVLLRVATSMTRRTVDAEDLVQETLLRAYRAIDRFDGAHPRAWLLTIMRNTEVNRHRRRRPSLLHDPELTLGQLAAVPGAGNEDPEAVVVGETFDTVVAEAFAALPVRHRQVVQLVDLDGLTYQEAAEFLGVPVGTVMSRLHRARARMRDRLAAAGLAPRRGSRP